MIAIVPRGNRPDVRNPLLTLPSVKRLGEWMNAGVQQLLACFLLDISRDAAARARESWSNHKAPMALYWKIVSVYARHLARVVRSVDLGREDI